MGERRHQTIIKPLFSSWKKDYKSIDFLEPIGKPKRKTILRSSRGRLRAQGKKSK